MIFDVKDIEYPDEWCYDENDNPVCTDFEFHDWSKGKPIETEFIDPNQLKLEI